MHCQQLGGSWGRGGKGGEEGRGGGGEGQERRGGEKRGGAGGEGQEGRSRWRPTQDNVTHTTGYRHTYISAYLQTCCR